MSLDEQAYESAMGRFKTLQQMKERVEGNKLRNRADVQILEQKISVLNQELIFLKQEMETARELFVACESLFVKQTEAHERLVEHLGVICTEHNIRRAASVEQLMQAMKLPMVCHDPNDSP